MPDVKLRKGQRPETKKGASRQSSRLKGLVVSGRGSAAVGEMPPQYVHSHANTATGRNHDCHTTLTNLFLALWGVTTAISFGIYGCENATPGVCQVTNLKKQKTGVYSYSRLIPRLRDFCNITRTPEYIKQLILLVSDKVSLIRRQNSLVFLVQLIMKFFGFTKTGLKLERLSAFRLVLNIFCMLHLFLPPG